MNVSIDNVVPDGSRFLELQGALKQLRDLSPRERRSYALEEAKLRAELKDLLQYCAGCLDAVAIELMAYAGTPFMVHPTERDGTRVTEYFSLMPGVIRSMATRVKSVESLDGKIALYDQLPVPSHGNIIYAPNGKMIILETIDGKLVYPIHDLLGIRVVAEDIDAISHTLKLLHNTFDVGVVKNYSAHPKPNGYNGIHAVFRGPQVRGFSPLIEAQLFTPEGALIEQQTRAAYHRSKVA